MDFDKGHRTYYSICASRLCNFSLAGSPFKPMMLLMFLMFMLTFHFPRTLFSQQPMNASFEGEPGWSITPPDWMPCKYNSTPDTQPEDEMNVTRPASDGNSYLGMVTRGEFGENANSTEACGTYLTEPLEQGGCYTMIMDLYLSRELGHVADWAPWQSYNTPVKLRVWAGTGECSYSELLFETPPVWDEEWTTYEFPFQPQKEGLVFLILEVDWIDDYTYYGNMMIDNIRIEKAEYPFSLGGDTTICYSDVLTLEVNTERETTVVWQDGTLSRTYEVTEPGVYWATAGEGDCTSSDTINIDFKECVRCNFFLPTLFVPTPEMPLLKPSADCEFMQFHLLIYNTMGQLVYETDDFNEGWNGKMGQLVSPTGIYIYNATYTAEDWGLVSTRNERGKILVINRYH
jgi:hypothetical protein